MIMIGLQPGFAVRRYSVAETAVLRFLFPITVTAVLAIDNTGRN